MPRRDVASLAEHRHPHGQHAVVRRAVRIVARRAVLPHRRVLPQHRPAHLGVTAGAALGHRAAHLERLDVADRPVRVVARRARHLALAHRHVGDGAFGLGDLRPVARGAQRGLRRLDELAFQRLRAVHAVARAAGEVAALVGAAFPPGVIPAVVARQARPAHLARASTPRTSGCCPSSRRRRAPGPGPWQLSQPCAAAGERGFFAWACGVPLIDSTLSV